MTQEEHGEAEFGLPELNKRVMNLETTTLRNVENMSMVNKDESQTLKWDMQADLKKNLENIRGNF